MYRSCITLLPAVLLMVGCATMGNREPDWVRNPKTVYPEQDYLVAVGEGDTRQAAENAAAANLSRIFEAHIESDERMVDTVKETNTDFTRTTDLVSDINILSSQTLINIQHAEAWKDASNRYHAVAYLKRRETAHIYVEQVEQKTARVEALSAHARQTKNPLMKYALLRSAVRCAMENDLILQQLKVLHPSSAASATPPYTMHELQQAVTDCAKQIRVQILIRDDKDGRITDSLQELVTNYGFVAGSPGVLGMTGNVTITDTGTRTAGLAFFHYAMSVQIQDELGNVVATINANGREAVSTPDRARERCYRTLEQDIRTRGKGNLDAYFDSLVEQVK